MINTRNLRRLAFAIALLVPIGAVVAQNQAASQSDAQKPTFINPPNMFDSAAHGYSQVAVVQTPAKFIYTAGQGGANDKGELSSDFEEQVNQALTSLQTALKAADADLTHVVKLTVFIKDHSMERLGIYEAAIKKLYDGRPGPAATLVPVPKLALDEMLFEIKAVAIKPM